MLFGQSCHTSSIRRATRSSVRKRKAIRSKSRRKYKEAQAYYQIISIRPRNNYPNFASTAEPKARRAPSRRRAVSGSGRSAGGGPGPHSPGGDRPNRLGRTSGHRPIHSIFSDLEAQIPLVRTHEDSISLASQSATSTPQNGEISTPRKPDFACSISYPSRGSKFRTCQEVQNFEPPVGFEISNPRRGSKYSNPRGVRNIRTP